jgi:hypothetical protein
MVAPVILIHRKKAVRFLERHGSTSPEKAVPKQDVPYSSRWHIRRLVDRGIIREAGDRWFLDPENLRQWRRKRRIILCAVLIIVLGLAAYFLIFK